MRNQILKKLGLLGLISLFIFLCLPYSLDAQFDEEETITSQDERINVMQDERRLLMGERFTTGQEQEAQKPQYVPGEVLVKFKEGTDPQEVLRQLNLETKAIERVHSIAPVVAKFKKDYKLEKDSDGWYWFLGKQYKEVDQIQDEEVFKEAYQQMSPERQGLYRNYKIDLPEGISVEEAVSQLRNNPNVEYAYPNYIRKTSSLPNDPRYSEQWALPKIKAPEAWDITEGSRGVVIAIIDTGVDYNHEDLFDNIWVNPGIVADRNSDGLIDLKDLDLNSDRIIEESELNQYGSDEDVIGYDFVSLSAADVYRGEDPGPPDNNPMDFHGHGTHSSGIAAAVKGNGIGIAGVAPRCRIMAVRAGYKGTDGWGYLKDSDIEQAILYAIDNGARVISMSFGGYTLGAWEDELITAHDKKVVLVAAAGNNDTWSEFYPAAMNEVIAVAATDQNDNKASFSNYGGWIDVAAPGVSILSTLPNNQYALWSGTSMACPHVAGLAALLVSYYPDISPLEAEVRIELGTDDIGQPGRVDLLGWERINAYRSLTINALPQVLLERYKFIGYLKSGEDVKIVIQLVNTSSSSSLGNVTAVLETQDSYVTIQTNTSSFGDLVPWELKDNSAEPFLITLDDNTPGGHLLEFGINIFSNGVLLETAHIQGRTLGKLSSRPILSIDDSEGNNNLKMDAGERVKLRLAVKNTRDSISNVTAQLICEDPYINIENPIVEFKDDNVFKDKMVINYYDPWIVNVDSLCPEGHSIDYRFVIMADRETVADYGFVLETSSVEKTIFVDAANKSGIENGTQERPFNTIQEGIDYAVENDNYTVFVLPGTYRESITMKSGVNVVGSDAHKTIIDATGYEIAVYADTSIIESTAIAGFKITADPPFYPNPDLAEKAVITAHCALLEVKDCLFEDNPVIIYIIHILGRSSNLLVWRNVFHFADFNVLFNWDYEILADFSNGIVLENVFLDSADSLVGLHSNIFAANNYFADCGGAIGLRENYIEIVDAYILNRYWNPWGISLSYGSGEIRNSHISNSGIQVISKYSSISAKNNIIENARVLGMEGQQTYINNVFNNVSTAMSGVSAATFRNNIFLNGRNVNADSIEWFEYNNFYGFDFGTPAGGTIDLSENIYKDPQFVNLSEGDYHLLAGSPCIDTGHPDPIYNDPDGTRNDMGCYGGPGQKDGFSLLLSPDQESYVLRKGDSLTIQLSVSDQGASGVEFCAFGLPDNSNFDADSGVFQFSPVIGDVLSSPYDIVFTARDDQGRWDVKRVSVKVLIGIQVSVFKSNNGGYEKEKVPVEGINVEAYRGGGGFTGIIQQTQKKGRTVFDLPEGSDFKFKVSYGGHDYWSKIVTSPGVTEIYLCTALTVYSFGQPVTEASSVEVCGPGGNPLYEYRAQALNRNGQAFFDLPEGRQFRFKIHISEFRFMGDFFTEVFTAPANIIFDISQQLTILTVLNSGQPVIGAFVQVCDPWGNPLYGYSPKQTDQNGQAFFCLPVGEQFKFKIPIYGPELRDYFTEVFTAPAEIVFDISQDTTPPTGTIKINYDAPYTATTSVTLNLSATDTGSGMGTGSQMQFSNDDVTYSVPEAYAITKPYILSSGDGTKTVYVKFKDVAGNWSSAYSDTIVLDITPPTGTIKINNDAPYTATTSVTLNLSATDTGSGMGTGSQMQFSNDNVLWSIPEAYAITKSWSLTPGGGTKTVYVKFRDVVGYWSEAFSDTIVLDTTPPTGAININNDVDYTLSPIVTLNLSATDTESGMGTGSQMQFSNDNVLWSTPEAYAINKSWSLTPGAGTRTVYAKFKDAMGNWSIVYSDTIILYTAPPPITINNGAPYTTSTSVPLNIAAVDSGNVVQMQFSNENMLWSTPEAYAITKSWSLTPGAGTKTVYVKFKDRAGNWSIAYSDTIILDTTLPTGTIKINYDAPYTATTSVTLTLSATDTGSGMGLGAEVQFSNENMLWSTPEAYAITKSWSLTPGDGTRIVYVKFKDKAGNWSSAYSDTIILDTTSPTGTIKINYDAPYTATTSVILNLYLVTDTGSGMGTGSQMQFSNDDVTYSVPEAYAMTKPYILSSGDGTRTVYVKFKDVAGNWSIAYSDTIILDTTSPTGTIKINYDAPYTATTSVTLNLSATDTGSGMGTGSQMQFSNDDVTYSVPEAYAITKPYILSSGDGTKTVYVKFKDAMGNWSSAYSDTIVLDITPPTGTIKINNDAPYTATTSVTLNLSATDTGSGMDTGSQMQFSNDDVTYSVPEAYATNKSGTLTPGTGTRTVYVKFKDVAGNWSSAYSDTIVLDTTPPTGTITINNGAAYTNTTSVTLNLSATDTESGMGTGSQMQFSNDGITYSVPEAYATTKSCTLTPGTGTKTVYVKFRDVVGNWSSAYSDTIVLDTPPILDPIGPKTVDEGKLLQFSISASDSDGDSLTYSATNLPPGASFDSVTKTFSWTPNFTQAGEYPVTFTVFDGALEDSETITITVNNVNRPPTVVALFPSSGTFQVNKPYLFRTVFSDPDGCNDLSRVFLIFQTNRLPSQRLIAYYYKTTNKLYLYSGLRYIGGFTPGSNNVIDTPYGKLYCSQTKVSGSGNYLIVNWSLSFKAPLVGPNYVYLLAGDEKGANTDWKLKGYITIIGSNLPPYFVAPIGNKTAYVGREISFTLAAKDPENNPIHFGGSAIPIGAYYHDNGNGTATFRWRPTKTGDYLMVFTVYDNYHDYTQMNYEKVTIRVK